MDPELAPKKGIGTAGSLLILIFGGGAALVIISLFLTGLAQKELLPRLRERTGKAVAAATEKAKHGPLGRLTGEKTETAGRTSLAPADSAGSATRGDSLAALTTQLETQRAFLEREKSELLRVRSGIDSVMSRYSTAQGSELTRQAKLLAGMRPEEAAAVMESMDDAAISALVGKMSSRSASRTLAKLDARRVARLSMAAISGGDPGEFFAPGAAADGEPRQ
jgi:flagellar motility protein MotE (MotC chaperone)